MLCQLYPLDKTKNASGERKRLEPIGDAALVTHEGPAPKGGIAPLLTELMARYSASGLPPAYLPKKSVRSRGASEPETAVEAELSRPEDELQGEDRS